MHFIPVPAYASLGRRGAAFLIDSLILVIPCAVISHIIPAIGTLLVYFLYAPILEASEIRATLGKYALGIQVTDLTGKRISLWNATVRNLLKFVSMALLLLGFFIALFTRRKQTLHDLLADTVVVYGREEKPVAETWANSVHQVIRQSSSIMKDAMKSDPMERAATEEAKKGDGLQKSASSSLNPEQFSALERLQALRERGALTEEEFQREKNRILDSR